MFKGLSIRCMAVLHATGAALAILAAFTWLFVRGALPASNDAFIAIGIALAFFGAACIPMAFSTVLRVKKASQSLETTSQKILSGDFGARFELEYPDCALGPAFDTLNDMHDYLVHQASFFQGIVKGIDTPFVVVDTEENLRLTNESLMTILEQDGKPEDHYGDNVAHFFYGDATRRTVLSESLEHHTITRKEVEFVGRKGGERNILIDASPLFDLNGNLMGALCIYQDLTALRTKESEVNQQQSRIADAVAESDTVSAQAVTAASDLSALVEDATDSAARQTQHAIDAAAAMEEMNAAVLDVAKNASETSEQANLTRDKASEGAEVVHQSTQAMDEVSTNTDTLRQHLATLGQYAEGIDSVMNVITDIADQTNLLALNAAIEAARAGEAGRGFAVVADEVRKLAEKTMGATKEVGETISAIQDVARISINDMESATSAVEKTRELSNLSGEALNAILSLATQTSDQVRAIAAAAEEQSATSEHISQTVEDVRVTSEQLSADMSEAAKDVNGLKQTVDSLQRIISDIQQ